MVQDQDVALKKLQKPRLQPTFIYFGGVGGGEGQEMHLRYKLSTLLSLNFLQWYAIGLSIVGDYEGNKAKLENSKIMKDHFEVRHMITIGKPVHKNHVA